MGIPEITLASLQSQITAKTLPNGAAKYAMVQHPDGTSWIILSLNYLMPDGSGPDQDVNYANAPVLFPKVIFDQLTNTVRLDSGSSVNGQNVGGFKAASVTSSCPCAADGRAGWISLPTRPRAAGDRR